MTLFQHRTSLNSNWFEMEDVGGRGEIKDTDFGFLFYFAHRLHYYVLYSAFCTYLISLKFQIQKMFFWLGGKKSPWKLAAHSAEEIQLNLPSENIYDWEGFWLWPLIFFFYFFYKDVAILIKYAFPLKIKY